MFARKCFVVAATVAMGLWLLGPGVACGALIASESFDYATGSLVGQNGGTGWSNAWSGTGTVGSPGLEYEGVESEGNMLAACGVTGGTRASRHFATPLSSGTVWLSFLAKGPTGTGAYTGLQLSTEELTGVQGQERLFFGNAGNGRWILGAGHGGFAYQDTGVAFGSDTYFDTYFIVGRIDFGAGTDGKDVVHMWVNPDPAVTPLDSAAVSAEQVHYTYHRAQLEGDFPGAVLYDELRIGTTYGSVVPEPTSFALLACGLVGVLAYAWRRRKK